MGYEVVIIDNKSTDRSTERDILGSIGADVRCTQVDSESDVISAANGADGIIVSAHVPLPRRVFEAVGSVRVIGRAGIGIDNIDIQAARDTGVRVLHVPDYCLDEVSTHTVALILACNRKLFQYDRAVTSGSWDWKDGRPIHRMSELTLGLISFGAIARRVAQKMAPFGVEVIAYDPYVDRRILDEYDVTRVSFERLLEESDTISIHSPLTDETRMMFDRQAFEKMNSDAVLVNTARGDIIAEKALCHAVADDEIAGAALDVLSQEPPSESDLFELDSVIVTPHAAWYSQESKAEVRRSVAKDVARALKGQSPVGEVDYDKPWHETG